ncbi:MAG TPA: CHAT domain-containing protein [Terracidiphilus sp.]
MQPRVRPAIYAAFANDVVDPGRKLSVAEEAVSLQDALRRITGEDDSWELIVRDHCSASSLVSPFYENRIAVFHYGGHASPEKVLLENDGGGNLVGSAALLEDFLATQPTLQLVFLNACDTEAWGKRLVQLGIPCVIATTRPIDDAMALRFSSAFYKALTNGDASIRSAFDTAAKGVAFDSQGQTSRRMEVGDDAADTAPASTDLPWKIYTPNGATSVEWKLSLGANDPLVGLPPLDPQRYPLPPSPYVSIQGHSPSDAQIFFGRNGEIRQLYDWLMNPSAPPVLLFYGQSGVGKSSLLNAGLLPRLPDSDKVKSLRRNLDLTDDLHAAIGGADDENVEKWFRGDGPRLIILDQVEEAITHKVHTAQSTGSGQNPVDELHRFLARVQQLFVDAASGRLRRPNGKARLILSFRKEYLAEIRNPLAEACEGLVQDAWLDRLDEQGIIQVVQGPTRRAALRRAYGIELESDFAEFVASRLNDPSSPIATVLQIVLNKLWDEVKASQPPRVYTRALYDRVVVQANPLEEFFQEQVKKVYAAAEGQAVRDGLELDVLLEHTSQMNTSRRREYADLRAWYPQVTNLEELLRSNKGAYLLAEPAQDVAGAADGATALAHDTLAPIVRREFALSASAGARARRLLENRARDWTEKKDGDPLDGRDLRIVELGLEQMRKPTPMEEKLLAESRRLRSKRRRAMLVWPALALVLLAGLVTVAVRYRIQTDHVHALVTDSEASLKNGDELSALVDSLAAMEATWRSRLLRSGSNAAGETLRTTLENTSVVGEYPLNHAALRAGPCAVAFDRRGGLRYHSVDDKRSTFDGKRVPPLFADQLQTIAVYYSWNCEPVSGRFLKADQTPLQTWRAGESMTKNQNGSAEAAAVAPDGNHAALATLSDAGSHKGARVETCEYTFADWSQAHCVPFEPIYLNYSPDGQWFGAVSKGSLAVWSTKSEDEKPAFQATLPGTDLWTPQFGATSQYPFVAELQYAPNFMGVKMGILTLWNLKDKTAKPAQYYLPQRQVTAYAFNKAGTLFAVGKKEGSVSVGHIRPDLNGGETSYFDENPAVSEFSAGNGQVSIVGFSPDSKYLATAIVEQDPRFKVKRSYVRVWDMNLARERDKAKTAGPVELLTMGCRRLETYLTDMTGGSDFKSVEKMGVVNLRELRQGCKAALKP